VPALELPDLDLDADLADDDVALIDDDVALIDDDDAAAVVDAGDDDFEFSVVWPDGSEQVAAGASVDSDFDSDEAVDIEPAFTETDDGELQFSMPPLELSDEPEAADADVPDDVADAVRRAIAAIESASVGDEAADVEAADIEVADIEVADIDMSAARRCAA
jgi:hypothetical protein